MKNLLLICIIVCLAFSGCAMLEKIAPSAIDEQGAVIAGTHELTATAKTVTGVTGPYGQAAAAGILLIWNFVERFRRNKNEKGLIATVKALKQAGDNPATKEAFEEIKGYLKNAHSVAGVNTTIKSILAKL